MLLASMLLVLSSEAFAQRSLVSFRDKTAANRVDVESVFKQGVNSGYMPVRVKIRNATSEPKVWEIEFTYSISSYGTSRRVSTFEIEVDKNDEVVKELYVPVPLVTGDSSYGNVVTKVKATGAGETAQTQNWNHTIQWAGIGVSTRMGKTMPALDNEMRSKSYGSNEFGGLFNPEHLPSDWRGYSGLDALIISDEEWNAVPAGPRKAIREWVRMGGRLDIYAKGGGSPVDFGFAGADDIANKVHHFSLGSVRVLDWNGTELNPQKTVRDYSVVKNRARGITEDFTSSGKWRLQKDFGQGEVGMVLVFILLIAFGILVGPINLFVFAKPGRRHKLFVTTPIISVIASLAILALIFLQDGVGGEGRRIGFANLQSGDEKRIFLIQEQISRTGVLLSTAFDPGETVIINPVKMANSKWNRLTDMNGYFRGNFETEGTVESGDWFASRSEQGQTIQTVRPTRSRIEVRKPADGDTPPVLFSSLEFVISDFYYRDRNGKVWQSKADKIAPGNEIPLKAVEKNSVLDAWWKERTNDFSDSVRTRIRKLDDRRSHFFCVTNDPKASLVDTLGSIRWKNDLVVMCGSVLPEGSSPGNGSDSEPTGETADQ